MNMNLKLDLDYKKILPVLQRLQPLVIGVFLIGAFAYTAFVINQALNVKASEAPVAVKPLPKISFDKKTIASLKDLNAVGGDVPLGSLGKDDPFK
jgi:hypothetical protein